MRKKKTRTCPPPKRLPVVQNVEQALELPPGALSNSARLELCGNRRVVIEGCRGIQAYEEDQIRLSTTSGTIRFMGLTDDSAVITGYILSVEFLS